MKGTALILPGRAYSPEMPLLEFARRALVEHDYDVQQVWWDGSTLGDDDPDTWVRERVVAAIADHPDPAIVVGKSLGTRAAPYVAERGWPAIWLTPLLVTESCVAGMRANPARQLLVGGLADGLWDAEVAADLMRQGCDVHEIPDADHALCVPAATVRSVEIQLEVARATELFLRSLS